jgi:alpha-glucosidase
MEITKDKYSIKYFPSPVVSWEQKGNIFLFRTASTILEIKLFSDKIVRFRYAPDGTFHRDFSYAIQDTLKLQDANLSVYEDRHKFDLMTEHLVIQVYKKNLKEKIFLVKPLSAQSV